MNEDQIQHYKKIYLEIQPPEYLSHQSWEDLSRRLPAQERRDLPIWRYSFIVASILLVLCVGTVSAASFAKPGHLLYPIKQMSQTIAVSIKKTIQNPLSQQLIPVKTVKVKSGVSPQFTPSPAAIKKHVEGREQITPSKPLNQYKGKADLGSTEENKNSQQKEYTSVRGENIKRQNNGVINKNDSHYNNGHQDNNKNANSSPQHQKDH